MSIAERRAEVAEILTENLPDIPIEPYKDSSLAPFTGYLQLNQTDTEGCTFAGEMRLTFDVVILVATDRTDFEKVQDVLTAPLINAIKMVGGRGITVQPVTDNIDKTVLYCLSATFVTETLIESEVV
jgi:hypothetical protein